MWERFAQMMIESGVPERNVNERAEDELREAVRLAREVRTLLDHAAPASGPRGHSIRIAQAISESLVTELEIITGKSGPLSARAKRLT